MTKWGITELLKLPFFNFFIKKMTYDIFRYLTFGSATNLIKVVFYCGHEMSLG